MMNLATLGNGLLFSLALAAGCSAAGHAPSSARDRAAADSWTGIYVPGPAADLARVAIEDVALVMGRGTGAYWVLFRGYLVPARAEGDALVVPRLPRPENCPLGARECEPPPGRLERVPGGIRIGQRVLVAHEASAFLRGLPESFRFDSVGGQDRLSYQRGVFTYEVHIDDAARTRCFIGVPVPNFRSAPVSADGYSARHLVLAFLDDGGQSATTATCPAIDSNRIHLVKTQPGLALVTNHTGQVVGAYQLSYMYEALFFPTPPPPDVELHKIARLGARALDAHLGQSAE